MMILRMYVCVWGGGGGGLTTAGWGQAKGTMLSASGVRDPRPKVVFGSVWMGHNGCQPSLWVHVIHVIQPTAVPSFIIVNLH